MAPKAQKEPTKGLQANKYTFYCSLWGRLELQKNSNIG